MSQTKKVTTINGRSYDAVTGLPVVGEKTKSDTASPSQSATTAKPVHSANIHTNTQKSQTLRRSSLTQPQRLRNEIVKKSATPRRTINSLQKSPQISKFTPQPAQPARPKMMDIGPAKHPHVAKIEQKQVEKAAAAIPKSAQTIKQEAVKTAIDNTVRNTSTPKRSFRHPRVFSIVTAAVALLILGGYLTYLNMPSLSVRVAAAAAGINASYPDYHPDGYSLDGPVAYDEGQVSMKFAANAGPQKFTIKQSKSNWDSSAVLDKYVSPKAGASYITYNERGLTIYTYGGNAAWVNGGILYTIEGDAPLSSEQIRRIATSFI